YFTIVLCTYSSPTYIFTLSLHDALPIFLSFDVWVFKSLPQMAFYFSNLILQTAGLKTGTSDKAGACFVSTGNYQGHQIITVVLHANGNNKDNRFVQT